MSDAQYVGDSRYVADSMVRKFGRDRAVALAKERAETGSTMASRDYWNAVHVAIVMPR